MIRPFQKDDLTAVMRIWLDTNIAAHSFLPEEYWRGNYQTVKELIPQAEVYVYSSANQIAGFIGLTDDYIAGLFVREDAQSKGIGKQLLNHAKSVRSSLRLSVYQKNARAVRFYIREDFTVQSEGLDSGANETELTMVWGK